MKVLFIFLVLLVTASSAHSQTTPTPVMTKQDYLKKSKGQKTAAWLFLAGGAALFVLGTKDVDPELGGSDETRSTAVVLTSIAALSASTVLFIASARNKRKGQAMAFNFKMENAPDRSTGKLCQSFIPGLIVANKIVK